MKTNRLYYFYIIIILVFVIFVIFILSFKINISTESVVEVVNNENENYTLNLIPETYKKLSGDNEVTIYINYKQIFCKFLEYDGSVYEYKINYSEFNDLYNYTKYIGTEILSVSTYHKHPLLKYILITI